MSDLIPVSTALTALQTWVAQAEGAYSPNTERAWRYDWQVFSGWCHDCDVPALPAHPDTIAQWARELAVAGRQDGGPLAVATIRRRIATIARVHRAAGLASPCDSEPVRLALKAVARERGTAQKQAEGLTGRATDRIADQAGQSPKDLRDVALVRVGRDLLARAGELVSLTVEMITWDEDGAAQVALRRIKTATQAETYQLGEDAAQALRAWLQGAGIGSGPVWRSLTKDGRLKASALTVRDVGRIVKARAGRGFSAHSLRVGMAQDLVAANIGENLIMQAGGWGSSQMVARYARRLKAKQGAVAQYYARRK